ncbi:hypothetical protein ACSNOC_04245, partial [Streptomyces sp. URMC 129]
LDPGPAAQLRGGPAQRDQPAHQVQQGVEGLAGPGTSLVVVTEPTETATGAAFAHTAVLAGRPGNAGPLAEAGRLFGRVAHLLDAVEDLAADAASGVWNPIAATGTPLSEVRRLCDDAAHGIRLALGEVEFTDRALAHTLLDHELRHAIDRAFGTTHHQGAHGAQGAYGPPGAPPDRGRRRGLIAGCAVWTGLFCTGQICCRDPYHDPWNGKRRQGWCRKDECGECCECCDCG